VRDFVAPGANVHVPTLGRELPYYTQHVYGVYIMFMAYEYNFHHTTQNPNEYFKEQHGHSSMLII